MISYLPALLTPSPPLWYATEKRENYVFPACFHQCYGITTLAIVIQGQHKIILCVVSVQVGLWMNVCFIILPESLSHTQQYELEENM